MVKVVTFHLEDWENDYLKEHLKGHEVVPVSERIQDAPEKAKDADVVCVFVHSEVTKEVVQKLSKAKLIATMSTGFDHIDLKACKKKSIAVCNVPTYGENTVAQHAMALLLNISKKIHQSILRTRKGDFSLDGLRGFDVKDKTLGVIGTGRIGWHMAHYANGFGMRVIAFDVHPNEALARECGFEYKSFDDVLAESDVLSLHVPETKETHHMINRDNLHKIKRGCVLINTARGGLVETEAILEGLEDGTFSACGLDVIEGECEISEERELLHGAFQKKCDLKTLLANHVLLEQENVFITPHNAFNTQEALQRILDTTLDNIEGFLANVPKNIVT